MLRLSVLAICLTIAAAYSAAAEDKLTPRGDGQNFTAESSDAMRIAGGKDRYDIELPTDVLFDFDKSKLRPESLPLLEKLKEHLAANRTDQIHVKGHTDSKGSDHHNFTLSQKRAKAVCDWLKRETTGGFNMCIGRGEQEPLVPNENLDGSDNPLNRQLNRRVTVSVVVYPDADRMLGGAKDRARDALNRLKDRTAPGE